MNNVVLIYINSFAVLVLLLVLRNYRRKFKAICCEEKVFVLFILATYAILVFEAVLQNLWQLPGIGIRYLLYSLQFIDFSLTVIIPMLWLFYCVFRLYHITQVSIKIRWMIALPALLYILLLAITTVTGDAFKIDADNQYERGIAYVASYIAGYAYIAAAGILITAKREKLNRGELIPYLLVPAIPVVLGITEAFEASPLGLMWAGTTLVILEIQMLVLNNRTNIDHLTSLNNRMALDEYTRRMMAECIETEKPLGILMIDVDDFKKINDNYGHIEGDRALKATADILRDCFSGKFFIARYGGDEFVVVMQECSDELMEKYLQKLQDSQDRHKNNGKPYTIRLSIGAHVFASSEIVNLHRLYMKVDDLMYQDKNAKKKAKENAQ